MVWSALVAFYRTSARHPLYTALNVLGLAFGIAVFLAISLYVQFELTFNRWMSRPDQIYQVTTTRMEVEHDLWWMNAPLAFDAIQDAAPDAIQTVMIRNAVYLDKGGEKFAEREYLVRGDFFGVFDVPILQGERATALRPGGAAISEALALRYFGRSDVVGQVLMLTDLRQDVELGESLAEAEPCRINAVFKSPPPNGSVKFDILRPYPPERAALFGPDWDDWRAAYHYTFLRLPSKAAADKLNAGFDRMVDTYGGRQMDTELSPGQARHDLVRVRIAQLANSRLIAPKTVATVTTFGSLGFLSLCVALLNYTNLATAMSGQRGREVGIRKAFGAGNAGLRWQFLGEVLLLCLVALAGSLSIVEMTMPHIAEMTGLGIDLDYGRDAWLLIVVISFVVLAGSAAGLYPAAVLSGLRPSEVLGASQLSTASRFQGRLRLGLVFLQFCAVTSLLIIIVGYNTQIRHMRTSDIGFSREGLLLTNSLISRALPAETVAEIRANWSQVPGVTAISMGTTPTTYTVYNTFRLASVDLPGREVDTMVMWNGPDYFKTVGVKILKGRDLETGDSFQSSDFERFGDIPHQFNAVINRRAVTAFGYTSPAEAVGRELTLDHIRIRIVGVVADHRMGAPSQPIPPLVFFAFANVRQAQETLIRFDGVDQEAVVAGLEAAWRTQTDGLPLELRPAAADLENYYRYDAHVTSLFGLGSALVALIGVIGLYGLAAFSTSARAIEIGLRKAMGATWWSVVRLLLFQFLKPVLLANLIAWPVAYIVLDRWLKQFDDRVALSLWFFPAGSGISLAVAVLTVAGLAFTAASTTPGKALRHE